MIHNLWLTQKSFKYFLVIKPDDTGDKNFNLQLDKDPQQEEFLQGRMLHNPYLGSSVGVVMRDVKNKVGFQKWCFDLIGW